MKLPSYRDAVLVVDPEAALTDGNLFRDSGPNGIDWTPNANYAAPNYGYGRSTANGAAYILANGTNQLATLAAAAQRTRLYALAPTAGMTLVVAQRFTSPAANDRILDVADAGSTRGVRLDFSTAERLRINSYDAGGVAASCTMTADAPFTGPRTRVAILALDRTQSLARAWLDGEGVAATFAGGTNPVAYDATVVPTLFAAVGGGNYDDADCFFLGWWPFVVSHGEARALSRWLIDRC